MPSSACLHALNAISVIKRYRGIVSSFSLNVFPPAGVVRGMLDVGGWHFRPSADGRSTHASYLFAIDIGGQVPQWIVNAGVSAQALTIAVVRKVGVNIPSCYARFL